MTVKTFIIEEKFKRLKNRNSFNKNTRIFKNIYKMKIHNIFFLLYKGKKLILE